MTSSARELSPVHIAILSPLVLLCTTAPHTSSELPSKPSPIKHISCKIKETSTHTYNMTNGVWRHTVSIQQLSSTSLLSFFSIFSSQRPPLLFLGSSHIGSIPSYMCVCVCVCCLLYTSPSPRDATLYRMPSSA